MRAFTTRHPYWVAFATVVAVCFVALQLVGRVIHRPRLPEDKSVFTNTEVQTAARTGTSPRRLVVVFHGVGGRALPDVSAIRTAYPDADLLVPQFSSSWLNNEDPLEITREFMAAIDRAVKVTPYGSITLVGYSLGALLARKWSCACTPPAVTTTRIGNMYATGERTSIAWCSSPG